MNFDLQQLAAFIAVAERGSFRAAAEAIHLSPPALSRRIERLEASLGIRLFHRTTREVELTGLGRTFLERARAAFDDLAAATLGITEIGARQSGRVTIGCVPSAAFYFLPSVIRPFTEQYPELRLRIIDENDAEVARAVIAGEADFGIGFLGSRVPELDFEPLRVDAFVLAVRRDHALAGRAEVRWTDLAGMRLLAPSRASGNRQLLDDALSRAGLRPVFAVEVNRVSTQLGMVEAGLGVGVVPGLTLPASAHLALVGIPLVGPSVTRTLGILSRHGARLHPAAQILHGHLRAAFRDGAARADRGGRTPARPPAAGAVRARRRG
ncbi:MAG: LysR family transcriptional regulator [Burkholderiales bacterium]|nr:LysR family transcriptional regulator [Burkholderiales bacterium]